MPRATEAVEQGATLLVRGSEAAPAGPELANAIAIDAGRKGDHIRVRMIDGLGQRDLHAIANGPIMDPNRIYLPAGRCSEDEMNQREA